MLDAYLIFDGNCADAMRFYERHAGRQARNNDDARRGAHGGPDAARQRRQDPARAPRHRRTPADGIRLHGRQPYEGMNGFSCR